MGERPGADEALPVFPKGSLVEVNTDEDGFLATWYVANVLETPHSSPGSSRKRKIQSKQNLFYVEYQSLLDDQGQDGQAVPLREHINEAFLRPLPPVDTHSDRTFQLYDAVDACYNDGWWAGVITEVLEDSRYQVTFQNPHDIKEFRASELRIHLEWVEGKWYSSREAGRLICSSHRNVEVLLHGEDFQDAWFPATFLEDMENGTFLVEYSSRMGDVVMKQRKCVNALYIRPSQPDLIVKSFGLTDEVDAFYDCGWWMGHIVEKKSVHNYVVSIKHAIMVKEFGLSLLRPRMEWKNGKWFSNSRHFRQYKVDIQYLHAMESGKRKRELEIFHGRSLAEIFAEEDSPGKEVGLPVIIGLECTGTKVPRTEKHHQFSGEKSSKIVRDQKYLSTNPEIHDVEELYQWNGKRRNKRGGRPVKTRKACHVAKTPPAKNDKPLDGKDEETLGQQLHRISREKQTKNIFMNIANAIQDPLDIRYEIAMAKGCLAGDMTDDQPLMWVQPIPSQTTVDDSSTTRHHQNCSVTSRANVVIQTPTVNANDPHDIRYEMAVAQGATMQQRDNCTIMSQEEVITQSPSINIAKDLQDVRCEIETIKGKFSSDVADEQPPLMLVGPISPTIVDDLSATTQKQHNCGVVNLVEAVTESPTVHANGSVVPNTILSLPFVKRQPIWKTFESMNVFGIMPQNPHFLPLVSCKEVIREGLAVGCMINFSNVVELTSSLQIDCPKTIIEEGLEVLSELQNHGFNIHMVRDRFKRLLLMKTEHTQLQERIKDLDSEIGAENHECTIIIEDIDQINQQIRELQERRKRIVAEKAKLESQIASMNSKLDDINGRMEGMQREFACVATASW